MMSHTAAMRPRVLLLSTAYHPLVGGSELAIQHIADRMPAYDFDVVTARFKREHAAREQIGRVRVFRVRAPAKILLPLVIFLKAVQLIWRGNYCLVHAYQASQASVAGVFLPGLPFVLTLQEGKNLDAQSGLIRFLRRRIIASADRVTAISGYLAAYASRYARVPVVVIPNGVDRAAYTLAQPEGPAIISVSRLVPKNGIACLVDALPMVLEKFPAATLTVVGDGPLKSALEAQAVSRGVSHAVRWAGTVPHGQLSSYLSRSAVFVRPALSEGLGSAFLEAMAAGVPIVGSAVGGIPDFLIDGETGLTCNPHDPRTVAEAICRILGDPALAGRLREQALALVRERYDWGMIAARMQSVYDELCAS